MLSNLCDVIFSGLVQSYATKRLLYTCLNARVMFFKSVDGVTSSRCNLYDDVSVFFRGADFFA